MTWWTGTARAGRPSLATSALAMVAGICGIGLVLFALQPLPLLDLRAHLDGAAAWLRGEDPYLVAIRDPSAGPYPGSGFVYPPYAILFFAGLHALGVVPAGILWQLGQLVALGWLTWDLAEPRSVRRLACLAILVVGFYPVITNLVMGQSGIFMVAAAWAAVALQRHNRDRFAAVLIALSALLKLFPMVMTVGLVRRRRWLAAAIAPGVVLAVAAASLPWVGPIWPEYLRAVLLAKVAVPTTFLDGQSILAATLRSVPAPEPVAHAAGLLLAGAVLVGVLLVVWRAGADNLRLSAALLLAALPVTLPYAWQHYYVLALPLLWLVLAAGWLEADWWLMAAALTGYGCLSIGAFTIDHWFYPIARAVGPLAGIYFNCSVVGGLCLLGAGVRLSVRLRPPSTISLGTRAA